MEEMFKPRTLFLPPYPPTGNVGSRRSDSASGGKKSNPRPLRDPSPFQPNIESGEKGYSEAVLGGLNISSIYRLALCACWAHATGFRSFAGSITPPSGTAPTLLGPVEAGGLEALSYMGTRAGGGEKCPRFEYFSNLR